MANWETHVITVVGPPKDIERFVKQYAIQSGESASLESNDCEQPSVDFGPDRYHATRCHVNCCDLEIEFEAVAFTWPATFYRTLRVEFQSSRIIWRYWAGDFGVGYIDETGDHRWHQDERGNWVADEIKKN